MALGPANYFEFGALVATPILGFIGSWGGIRVALKALRDDLNDTKRDVRDMRRRMDNLSDHIFGRGHGA